MKCQFYITFLIVLLGNCFSLPAQTMYRAGISKVSIEPSSYPFSLALAGYGLPREGRFTVNWIPHQGMHEPITTFTGSADKLFFISNGKLLCAQAGNDALQWKYLGSADGIKAVAANKRKLFGIDSAGNIFCTAIKKGVHWKKIGQAAGLIGLTIPADVLYAADRYGNILYTSVKGKRLNWQKLSMLEGLQSLSSYRNSLYALTRNNEIFRIGLSGKPAGWVKIAAYNDISYNVHLKTIAVAGDTLYGMDDHNQLFSAHHKTKGDLSVTALAVADGRQTVVLAGADLTGFNIDLIRSIKQEVFEKYRIPSSAILINASHTHFAPVSQRWPTWVGFCQEPDSFYLNAVVKPAMVKAIEQAIKSMTPSELSFGRGRTAIGGNRALSDPPVPYDDAVDVISITRRDNRSSSILFLTGCHPVFKNEGAEAYTISPNYPGATRSILQTEGSVAASMFLQGCGGDINPIDANTTAERLAKDILSVLNGSMVKLNGEISAYMDSVVFPVQRWSRRQILDFRTQNAGGEGNVEAEKNVRWADLMLDPDRTNQVPATMPVYIQTINIGNWKLVGLSREAVTDYSISIKKLWPGQLVSVAGYCNDVSSYLPTSRHIRAGTYEGFNSFFWYGQPSVFPETVQEDILSEIKKQNH